MLYQSTATKTLNSVSIPVKTRSVQSICIKNNKLESIEVSNRRDNIIQMAKVLGELTLMCIGLVDLRKYDKF